MSGKNKDNELVGHKIIKDLEGLATPVQLFRALPGNPRRGDVQSVVKSYQKFGQRKPIVARRESDDTLTVISGNHQLLAVMQLGWTHIAAVVVDVGAPLSHAIIVSRELGIPCVVSATDATRKIPNGALIQVNGDSGVVTVLDE